MTQPRGKVIISDGRKNAMKSFARVAAFGLSLAGLCCGEASAAISYEEEIPAFRNGVDRYNIHVPASGEWDGDKFVVSVTNRQNFYMSYSRFPGMKPFRGADEIVLRTEAGDLGRTTAELILSEFPAGTHRKFLAPLAPEEGLGEGDLHRLAEEAD